MSTNTQAAIVSMLSNAIAEHGCTLKNIDFDQQTIDIEAPDDKRVDCAMALADIMG